MVLQGEWNISQWFISMIKVLLKMDIFWMITQILKLSSISYYETCINLWLNNLKCRSYFEFVLCVHVLYKSSSLHTCRKPEWFKIPGFSNSVRTRLLCKQLVYLIVILQPLIINRLYFWKLFHWILNANINVSILLST